MTSSRDIEKRIILFLFGTSIFIIGFAGGSQYETNKAREKEAAMNHKVNQQIEGEQKKYGKFNRTRK